MSMPKMPQYNLPDDDKDLPEMQLPQDAPVENGPGIQPGSEAAHTSQARPGHTGKAAGARKPAAVKPALKSRIDSLFFDIREEVVEPDEQSEKYSGEVQSGRESPAQQQPIAAPVQAPEPGRIPPEPIAPPESLATYQPPTSELLAKPRAASAGSNTKPLPGVKPDARPARQLPAQPGQTLPLAFDKAAGDPSKYASEAPLSSAGVESMKSRTPVYFDGLSGQMPGGEVSAGFSAMAVPFRIHGDEVTHPEPPHTRDYGAGQPARSSPGAIPPGYDIGLLEVLDDTPNRYWNEDERRLVEQVADQLSLALENANLFQRTQSALEEVENRRQIADSLRQIANLVGASLELREVVERLLDQLPNLIPFTRATIQLVQDGQRQLLGGRGFDIAQSLQDPSNLLRSIESDALIREVYHSQKPLVLSDTRRDPRWEMLSATDQVLSWIAAPMVAAGEVVGFLLLDNQQAGAYTQETADLAMAFASQAALAIRNARLFKQVQDSLAETDALYQASAELNTAQTYQDILFILQKSSLVLSHPDLAALHFCVFDSPWKGSDRPEWMLKIASLSFSGSPAQEASNLAKPGAEGINARVIINSWTNASDYLFPDRPSVIPDLANNQLLDRDAQDFFQNYGEIRTGSLLVVPLSVGGQWIGILTAVYRKEAGMLNTGADNANLFGPKLLRSLEALSSQAAVSIQNIRLFDETRRRAAQLETAAEIARDTSGTLALDILLNRAVNLIRDRYGYYHASIYLIDDAGRSAVVRESTGVAGQELKRRGHSLPVGSQSVIGQVTQTGETLLINDVSQSAIFRSNPLLPETKAELAIALKTGARRIGALDVQSNFIDAFSNDDLAVLRVLADQLAVAVDNARSYELAQQAVSETAQRVQELSTIYDVTQSISNAEMKTQEIGHIIAERFVNLLPVDRVTVYILEKRVQETAASLDLPESIVQQAGGQPVEITYLHALNVVGPFGEISNEEPDITIDRYPFFDSVAQSSRPLIWQLDELHFGSPVGGLRPLNPLVGGAAQPQTSAEIRGYLRQAGLRTLVLVPLSVKAQLIGLVDLQAQKLPVNPDSSQLNLMMTMANAAAVALENARLYEQQIKTAEQLRDVDKLKSQFLANMSHELRTPLNSIIGFSRVILKGIDGPVSDLQQQDLIAIHSAGNHLLQLITDVLDISKIEAGKMELALDEKVNLGDLAVSAMSTAVGLTKDKPIKLVKQIEPNIPLVKADPTRIRQVMINFLSNAAKFTDEGTITVNVSKLGLPPGAEDGKTDPTSTVDWVCVKVIDTGPGISKKDQSKLFLPFSQVDSSSTRKVGGTGLGLSISRLLIEMHNGRIGVESEVGKGATFYFCLPAQPVEPPVTSDGVNKEQLTGQV